MHSQEILWPGHYTVGLDVQDQQGKSCEVQKLEVRVCTCTEEQVCQPQTRSSSSTVLGAGGVLVLLLGILLLLCEYHHLSLVMFSTALRSCFKYECSHGNNVLSLHKLSVCFIQANPIVIRWVRIWGPDTFRHP